MADLPTRIVIREEAFEDELHVLIRDAESADEYTTAAEIVLASDPRAGSLLHEGPPEVWALPLFPVAGKAISLLYTFDDGVVYFLGLRPE
jgi:hypothetical protein